MKKEETITEHHSCASAEPTQVTATAAHVPAHHRLYRTRYRQKKLVSYYMIDGRTYYKASEVQTFLKKKGRDMPAVVKSNPK